jgi:elongation factor G
MPVSKGDEEKIANGLARLIEEDPTIKIENNPEVHQNILWGMGELHLAIIKEKLKDKFDIDIETNPPEVAYKETIKKPAKSEYKYKKQSGEEVNTGMFMRSSRCLTVKDLNLKTLFSAVRSLKTIFQALKKG